MPDLIQRRFEKNLIKFFYQRDIQINSARDSEFFQFMYQRFCERNPVKLSRSRSRITTRFVNDSLAELLGTHPTMIPWLSRASRPKRPNRHYSSPSFKRASGTSTGSLIQMLGRGKRNQYKVTGVHGSPLTPRRREEISKILSAYHVSNSPFKQGIETKEQGLPTAEASSGSYEQSMVLPGQRVALWQQKTPGKSPEYRVRFKDEYSEPGDMTARASLFPEGAGEVTIKRAMEFSVTRDDIERRIDAKRPCSQKKAMGNVTALERLEALGAVITEKQSGRDFHWAHRQGWGLGGSQSKENLDAMTAGGNYATLFKVEAPIKELLYAGGVGEVFVRCEVDFLEDREVPHKVTYHLSWGGEHRLTIFIDPLSHRRPLEEENDIANDLFEASSPKLT